MNKIFISILAIASVLSAAPKGYDFKHLKELPPKDSCKVYGDKIRRAMHLLSTSTKERPNKVKILFYGQSITRQDYSRKIIEAQLREKFPHAQLEVLNPAIGGYTAPKSVHTMFHTLIPHQPDLVVFHVYGGEKDGNYEQIVKNIRKYTTAELIEVTHHLDDFCDRVEERNAASAHRKEIAEKYDSELVDVRKDWEEYLSKHCSKVKDFLTDKIHLNRHGGELWGALQARHFEVQKADPRKWQGRISRVDLKKSKQSLLGLVNYDPDQWVKTCTGLKNKVPNARLEVHFMGSRMDVISLKGCGMADILVDGKPPSEHLETWAATLPSPTPIDYRPGIMRLGLGGKPVDETWTLTANSVNCDGKEFNFSLQGSVSGGQGCGDHKSVFRSSNGVIELQPKMFRFADAISIKKKPLSVPFEVKWDVYNTSLEQWKFEGATEENPSGQVTLVQQLPNTKHLLEIIPRSGEVEIGEILIYRPGF